MKFFVEKDKSIYKELGRPYKIIGQISFNINFQGL